MSKVTHIKSLLQQAPNAQPEKVKVFYKTGAGHYAEHDQFIGVNVPTLKKIAKNFRDLCIDDIETFLASPINEERLLALFILTHQYRKANTSEQEALYQFYIHNLKRVNNWNLVDSSAHLIIGAHLMKADRTPLLVLAKSIVMWERRIAIVATWYFIRNNDLEWTFKLAKILLNDRHDLIHKAVGWMLREAGKKNIAGLISFLDQHASKMPRTMLRYSIEKLPEQQRKSYLRQPQPVRPERSCAAAESKGYIKIKT